MLTAAQVAPLLLTADELQALTGYRRGAEQLAELRRRGFHRAYRNPAGRVVLERAHFEAISSATQRAQTATAGPAWSKVAA